MISNNIVLYYYFKMVNINTFDPTVDHTQIILNLIKKEIDDHLISWKQKIRLKERKIRDKISRSYFKIEEIYNYFSKIDLDLTPNVFRRDFNKKIKRFHMAEAPGGFIQFCNKFYDNNNFETISFMSSNKNIPTYHNNIMLMNNKIIKFKNCDITNFHVINFLITNYKEKYDLVTSDGGIFINNYEYQEQKSTKLIASEIYISLFSLKKKWYTNYHKI